MIEVRDLTKRYAGHTAVDDISFTVERGEIVGLLGPNGAGKSTTMRILSSFLPATSGTARVAGLDVCQESLEVRRRIGFMPENNPLHTDMRVREYLKFRARIKGLGTRLSRERVDTVMEQCGITDVAKKLIGQLSKGYRQRVGLADALVHEPDLIILDELTYPIKFGWLDLDIVLNDLKNRPAMQHVVITGRGAPEGLIAAADTVTEMTMVKHAFKAGIKAMPGVEF